MKKTHFIFAIVFLMSLGTAQAQYFWGKYAPFATIGNGLATKATGIGHVMAGAMQDAFVPFYGFSVVRTDVNGGFASAAEFNRSYELLDVKFGGRLWINSAVVEEYADGSGYAVMGGFESFSQDPDVLPAYGLYFVQLDPNGNIMTTSAYITNMLVNKIDAISITKSTSTPGHMFATGSLSMKYQEKTYMWAARIDQSGVLQWGNIYDLYAAFLIPRDIIESPYDKEVIVVGGIEKTIGARDGYWLSLDANNGNVGKVNLYDMAHESISAINIDSQNKGFVLCGITTYLKGTNAFWGFDTDPTGTSIIWSYVYDDKDRTLSCHSAADVIEYIDKNAGKSGYYITGGKGLVPNSDVMTLKLDGSGIAVSNGLILYDKGYNESAYNIDLNLSGTGDGVSVYVWDQDGTDHTMDIIKSDFDGRLDCEEKTMEPVTDVAPVKVSTDKADILDKLNPYDIVKSAEMKNTSDMICFKEKQRSAPTGIAGIAAGDNVFAVYPNPFNEQLNIKGNAMKLVEVYNMLGQVIVTMKVGDVTETTINTSHWQHGIYNIKITDHNGAQQIIKVMK